jgi:uncharacterized protein (TIGR03067 family)
VQATLDQDADQAARPVRRFPKESPAPTAAALDPTESARPVRRKRPKRKKKTATSSALWRWLASVVLLVLGIGVGVYAWKKGRHGEPGTLTSSSDVVHSKPDPVAQPEQEHLQGTWQVIAIVAAGQKVPDARVRGLNLRNVYSGNQITITRPDRPAQTGTFTVDAAHVPARLTLRLPDGPVHAVYQITGDQLQLCLMVDEQRPNEFPADLVSRAAPQTDLLTLQRQARPASAGPG